MESDQSTTLIYLKKNYNEYRGKIVSNIKV